MQVNRERLLELAIQGGATIDNAERVASAWEKWVKDAKDSWPTPFDETSSPAGIGSDLIIDAGDGDKIKFVWNGNKVKGVYLRDGRFTVKKPSEPEIDWSRPQLVISNKRQIVRTDGKCNYDETFSGVVVDCGRTPYNPGYYSILFRKSDFVYHGEIPQEQQEGPTSEDRIIFQSERNVKIGNLSIADAVRHASILKGSLLIAREGDQYDFDVLKINHRTGEMECIGSEQWFASMPSASSIAAADWQVFTLDEKISEDQQVEPKTTGLNFLEAALVAKNSRARIGRLSYEVPLYFEPSQSGDFLTCTGSGYAHSLSIEDFMATDWQIIEP